MMPGLFDVIGPIFAQAAGNPNNWTGFLILLPIPVLFYFMIWLPQQQQEKKRRAMIDAIKKNDKVVTAAGIFGTVISVDPAARQGRAPRRRRQGGQAEHDPGERGASARSVVRLIERSARVCLLPGGEGGRTAG